MSDINFEFPIWMVPLLFGALYWPGFLVAAIVLAVLGMLTRGRARTALFALGILALLPCLAVPVLFVGSALHSAAAGRAYARLHETLTAPLEIQGLALPVGTAVTWADERHQAVVELELPGPTPLLGTRLTGKLEDVYRTWWSGTLAADATLGGWPCAAGDVWLSHEGRLMRCTLAADHEDTGLTIPAGSEIALTDAGRVKEVRLPADRTMALPSIGATLPGRSGLFLEADGSIERAYVPEPGVLALGDVALRFDIRWLYPEGAGGTPMSAVAVRGDLAADTTIDGVPVPAGSLVTVDLGSRLARLPRIR